MRYKAGKSGGPNVVTSDLFKPCGGLKDVRNFLLDGKEINSL